jgi:hypothetical protein
MFMFGHVLSPIRLTSRPFATTTYSSDHPFHNTCWCSRNTLPRNSHDCQHPKLSLSPLCHSISRVTCRSLLRLVSLRQPLLHRSLIISRLVLRMCVAKSACSDKSDMMSFSLSAILLVVVVLYIAAVHLGNVPSSCMASYICTHVFSRRPPHLSCCQLRTCLHTGRLTARIGRCVITFVYRGIPCVIYFANHSTAHQSLLHCLPRAAQL